MFISRSGAGLERPAANGTDRAKKRGAFPDFSTDRLSAPSRRQWRGVFSSSAARFDPHVYWLQRNLAPFDIFVQWRPEAYSGAGETSLPCTDFLQA